jgi:hypothetical protein
VVRSQVQEGQLSAEDWMTITIPFQGGGGWNRPGTTTSNPACAMTQRGLRELSLRSQVKVAQDAFDAALELVLAGEEVRVVSERDWRRVANQALEPARRAKVRQASERRRAAQAALKAQRRGQVPDKAVQEAGVTRAVER